jgi:hypothetical protein
MKTTRITIASIAIALTRFAALAQQPVITSFPGNGQLTWTNSPATNAFTVQWAPALAGPWSSTWQPLDSLVVTGAQTTVAVPMFYRVAKGFSLASQRGIWILNGPLSFGQNVSVYYIAQDDGIISESAAFLPGGPAGFFTVGSSGRVTNTFVSRHSPATVITGTFAEPNQIVVDPLYGGVTIRRVQDSARCAGAWSGTLYQTNLDYGLSTNYSVAFTVDARGLVTDLTGFPTNTIGRMFALNNGTVGACFFTGASHSDYEQIRISGALSGNSVSGTFENNSDVGILGSVSLDRH